MNKLVKGILVGAMSLSLVGCGSSSEETKTLKVFNWGEYIDESVIEDFEKEFNCDVIYETFDTNESMYTKILGGNQYDVLIPSEYMIERLVKEDLVQKVDMTKITNLSNVDQELLNKDFDPNQEYWVPYFTGNVGIVYDTTVVDEADLAQEWEILRNEKYAGDIYMYDSVRDSLVPALKSQGYSMNTTSEAEVEAAYNWLVEQKNTMDPVYGGDEVIDAMVRGEKAMALMYSGDAAYIISENEDMDFFMPETAGTNYWFDGMVLTKDSQNVELATEFMNYMLRDDVALKNTTEVGYYSSNVNASKEASEGDYAGNSAYGMRIGDNDEYFTYQDDATLEMYNTYWEKLITQ